MPNERLTTRPLLNVGWRKIVSTDQRRYAEMARSDWRRMYPAEIRHISRLIFVNT
jgi:hypothetical protein